jgi:hypothetical protein
MATKNSAAAFVLLATSFLSACSGDVRWTKADASEEAMANDMAFCRKQAQAMYGSAGTAIPQAQIDPRFGPTGPSPADRVMQESQAVGNCMRGKGYTLITVETKK